MVSARWSGAEARGAAESVCRHLRPAGRKKNSTRSVPLSLCVATRSARGQSGFCSKKVRISSKRYRHNKTAHLGGFIMAEREGFEPSRGFEAPYRISNPAPSASWVSLHAKGGWILSKSTCEGKVLGREGLAVDLKLDNS